MFSIDVILEEDKDGGYVAKCPAFPGCNSQGETEDEAMKNILDALELWLKTQQDRTILEWSLNDQIRAVSKRELQFTVICSR